VKGRGVPAVVPSAPLRERLAVVRLLLGRCNRGAVLVTGALILLSSFAGAAQSVSLKWMVDGATEHRLAFALTAAVVGAASSGIIATADRTAMNLADWIANTVGAEVSAQTLRTTARMPGIEHLERAEYLDQVSIVNREGVNLVRSVYAFAQVGSLLIRIVTAVWLLASVQPLLALLPLFVLPSLALVGKTKRITERARDDAAGWARASDNLHRLFFTPSAAMEMRIFGCSDALNRRADELWRTMTRVKFAADIRADAIAAIGWACIAAGYVFSLAVVIDQVSTGRATIGDVLMVSALALQLRASIALSMNSIRESLTAVGLIDRYIWLRDQALRQARCRAGRQIPPERLESGLCLEGVSFTYPGSRLAALSGIDLFLPAGTTVALVGPNGAGKTTLVKLLCRFYEPTGGRIMADGADIAGFDIEAWRMSLAGSFQDFARIETVLRRSVGCGAPEVMDDEARVSAAAERAGLAGLVDELPDGLGTHLGKSYRDGAELSGGQWQKVAIARGLMRPDPLLLLLDEPTSALDPAAEDALHERYVGEARRRSGNGGITIIVSHRFSSVRMADLIVVVDGGRVEELGSHAELMGRGGHYASMFTEQASAYT
jgi:ATP-binding cassette, subfamily B, bacterial